MRSIIRNQSVAVRILCVLLAAAVFSCGGKKSDEDEPVVFTADESYLIDAYARVRTAAGYFPKQPMVAESLFAVIAQEVDTLRIANTISLLNTNPDRWIPIFEEIEARVREDTKEKSEQPGS